MTDPLTIAAVVTTAIGTNVQYQAGQRAADAQKAAQNTQRRRQNIQALREAQIRRATLQQQSANAGVLSSSGYSGGAASLQSQLASNIGYSNALAGFAQQQADAMQTAQKAGAITKVVNSAIGAAQSAQDSLPVPTGT